jgi:hypothetical protein
VSKPAGAAHTTLLLCILSVYYLSTVTAACQVLPYETIHARSKLGYSRHKPLKRLLQACAKEGRKVLIFAPQRVTPQQLKQQLFILMGPDYKVTDGVGRWGEAGRQAAGILWHSFVQHNRLA